MKLTTCRVAVLVGVAASLQPTATYAQTTVGSEGSDSVIVVTAPGAGIDMDDAQVLNRQQLSATGSPDVISSLTRENAGVTLQDPQGNPWQPNVVYRGFVSSPLQGQAQGLAVYLDGGRFNQPFGDTVGLDLLPNAALHSVSLVDASPAYGLNALGGSLLLTTMTGRSDPGVDAAFSVGGFGRREASLAGGGAFKSFSYFGALQYRSEDGWRDFSPSKLYNGYIDIGYDGARGGLHLKAIGADTNLTGNGVSPVELLAARRASVLSWPDNSRSRYGRISLHPWIKASRETRIEGTIYLQRLRLANLNGDFADIEECDNQPGLLCLESATSDDGQLLTDTFGAPIADSLGGNGYGVLNRGTIYTRSSGVIVQVVDRRGSGSGTNSLVIGFSYDTSTTDFATETELGALTASRSVTGLGLQIVQADHSIAPVSLQAKTNYWGLFLADTLPLGGGFTAEIGIRYNSAGIKLIDQIGTALNGEHRYVRLNPGIELGWQLDPTLSLRIGYAETNRAPTPAELSCADENAPCSLTNFFVADPPLEQVVARTWEVGASGEWKAAGWTINWAASAYRVNIRNDIQYIASNIRGRAYFQNTGSNRRQGAEVSIDAKRGGLRVSASYAFTDAKYLSAITLSSPANPAADNSGKISVQPGDSLPGIPRHSFTLSADFQGKIGMRAFTLGGDLSTRSSQWLFGDEANLTLPVPGYTIIHLRGSVELFPRIMLFGELRNAFDRDFATFGTFSEVDEVELTEAPGAREPRALGPGAPRRWTIGVQVAF